MGEREAFERILASLHEAALDDTHWPTASALIDDALGVHGNCLVYGDANSREDIRIYYAGFFYHGQRHREWEREYFDVYFPLDERIPRLLQLPDSQLVHMADLFTEEELKTSAVYNDFSTRVHAQNSIDVRMDGPGGSCITWGVNDPVDGNGWSSARLGSMRRLLPHIRQFVSFRQALAGAGALGASLMELLETTGSGIIQLDRRGRIVEVNDRARDLLRTGDGLFDERGFLFARRPEDNDRLQGLLARALPPFGVRGVGGSMMVGRASVPAAGAAREPGGQAGVGHSRLAGRGAHAGRGPFGPEAHRSGHGRGGPRPDRDGKPGGGIIGRRHECQQYRGGDGSKGKHDPLACEEHVHQARPLPAGRSGASFDAAGRRPGVSGPEAEPALGLCRFSPALLKSPWKPQKILLNPPQN